MQSSKTSKKTRQSAEDTVAAVPETVSAPELKSKSRASKSSSAKKESSDTGRVKHRAASATESNGASRAAVDSPVIDPVGVMTPAPKEQEVSQANIAQLAYSYWIARDYAHGFAEEDWHRAERELKSKR